jgi:agmatine deiminase
MPAEWEPHRATWISWPHHEPDWPGKLGAIPWVYAEIARVLAEYEQVEILCHDNQVRDNAASALAAHGVDASRFRLHLVATDRVWLRDSAPTGVIGQSGEPSWLNWAFNGWAKYPNHTLDSRVGEAIAAITGLSREQPRDDEGLPIVLEGGGFDVNGAGLVLTTEEWLLSDVQVRNPGRTRLGYEQLFSTWLNADRTIWLGEGCVGDDTHGHVDDIARFVATDTIVLAVERDPADENHRRSLDNLHRLERAAADPAVGPLQIVEVPFPRPVMMNAERLPASYANFYIANGVVLVPTFNDIHDRVALRAIAEAVPDRRVIGIHAVDLVWGLGTLHCLTQQEPAAPAQVSPRESVTW